MRGRDPGRPVSLRESAAESEDTAAFDVIRSAGIAGATAAQIGAALNVSQTRVESIVASLMAAGRTRPLSKPPASIAAEFADTILAQAVEDIEARQRERPWVMGVTSLALAHAVAIGERDLIRILAPAVEAGSLAYRSGYYATTDFTPRLTDEQRLFFERVFAVEPPAQPAPLAFAQLRAQMRSSPVPELSQALDMLIASGALSKVGDFVYRGAEMAGFRAQLESALRQRGQLTVAEFRTLTGTSRKYAVPLLEFFDATGVTIRTGDVRILRPVPAPRA